MVIMPPLPQGVPGCLRTMAYSTPFSQPSGGSMYSSMYLKGSSMDSSMYLKGSTMGRSVSFCVCICICIHI